VLIRWRDRVDRVLTWKRARTYALVLVGLLVAAWVDVLVLGSPPLNASGTPLGGDYIAFHTAGRLVLSGRAAELYDHSAVSGVEASLLGGRMPNFYDAYRNPPFVAALFAPLALVDLLPAFAVYSVLSLACLGLALWLLVQEAAWLRTRWRGLVVLVLAFPPVYFGLIDGENATLSLLVYALIYRALARGQDRAAGAWAALGLLKPQLFFVFPLVFLASRRWRALSAYALVALGLLGVSLLMVGPDGLAAWLRILLEPESANARANAWRMASLKSFFDLLLPADGAVALALYALSSVALLVPLLRAWSRSVACLPALWAWTSLVAVLIDPHLVDYDMTVLVAAAVIATPFAPKARWPIVLVYLVTLFRAQLPISDASVQFTVPLLALCALLVARAYGQASHESAPRERVPRAAPAEVVSVG